MSIIDVVNNYPAVIGLFYLAVELIKALWKHREADDNTASAREDRVSKIVFDMLEQSKEGLVDEKKEILKLTEHLKRANFEISILERKVATLMSVIDRCISENPTAHIRFETAMEDFNSEIDNMRKIKHG